MPNKIPVARTGGRRPETDSRMDRLKLIALDNEDLAIISAHCQDAVMKSGDLQYFVGEKRFSMAMNRFVWEEASRKSDYQRRRSVLHFERVEHVRQ